MPRAIRKLAPLILFALAATAFSQGKPSKGPPRPTAAVQRLIDQASRRDVPWKDAPPIFERALALARRSADRPGEASALVWLGSAYNALQLYPKARESFSLALPIQHAIGDRMGEATCLNNIAVIDDGFGERTRALTFYGRALPILRTLGDRAGEANTLNNVGAVYDHLGDWPKALKFYNQALAIRQKIGDRKGEATTLNNIGLLSDERGDRPTSITSYERALPIFRALGDRASEATVLNNLGLVYENLGLREKALDYYRQALPICREIGDRVGEATALCNLGTTYDHLGDRVKALASYQQALTIQRGLGNRGSEGRMLGNLGVIYDDLGERAKALASLVEALSILRAVGDRVGEATILDSIGVVYEGLGERTRALKSFNAALAIQRAVGDRVGEATTLGNLGLLYEDLNEHKEALATYEKALPLLRAVGNRTGEARTLNDLGITYDNLGEPAKAQALYEQALTIQRSVGDRSGEARTLDNLGSVDGELGKREEALALYEKALPIQRAVGDRAGEAKTLESLGAAHDEAGSRRLAILFGKQSVNVYQSLRADAKGLDAQLRKSYAGTVESAYRGLADRLIAEGRIAEAQQVLDLLKDEEYYRFARASSSSTVDLTPREQTWKQKYEEAGEALAKAASDYDDLLKLAQARELTAEEKLRKGTLEKLAEAARVAFDVFLQESRAAFADAKVKDNRLDEVQNSTELADQLAKMPGTAGIYTLVTKDGVRTILTLPSVTEIKAGAAQKIPYDEFLKKVALLRRALADDRYDPRPVAADLYDILVRPLESELEGAGVKSLLWSLDGPLRYVPLAALYDRKTGKYLVEKYPCGLFVPAKLTKLANAPNGQPTGAGFGVTKGRTVDGESFSDLRAVAGEMAALKTQLGASVDEDAAFTEARLKDAITTKRPAIVHLATHFRLRPGDAERSFLLLGDGTLTVTSFAHWPQGSLRGVDILVLSACDTATPMDGDRGDGGEFESFARVALTNGAASVLASLWPVDDVSTGLLMSKLYELRKTESTLPKLEALRRAQLWLIFADAKADPNLRSVSATALPAEGDLKPFVADPAHPFTHPHYWAPFVLTGNPR